MTDKDRELILKIAKQLGELSVRIEDVATKALAADSVMAKEILNLQTKIDGIIKTDSDIYQFTDGRITSLENIIRGKI